MAKKKSSELQALNFVAWFTGVIVSLVVGNAMIQGVLSLPGWLGGTSTIGIWIAAAIGWIVIITTLIGAILAILRR